MTARKKAKKRTQGQAIFKALGFNIIDNDDRHLKGKLAEMVWDRIYRSKLVDRFTFMPTRVLQVGGHRPLLGEPSQQEIRRMERLANEFLAPNIFATKDIKFLLTKVAHGRGPPSFDYVGIEKANNKKVILDIKSTSKSNAYLTFSSNEQEVIAKAKTLNFGVYVASIMFLQNWNVKIRLIKL